MRTCYKVYHLTPSLVIPFSSHHIIYELKYLEGNLRDTLWTVDSDYWRDFIAGQHSKNKQLLNAQPQIEISIMPSKAQGTW